jgi:hypothetical protein
MKRIKINTIKEYQNLPIGTVFIDVVDFFGFIVYVKISKDKSKIIENTMINLFIGDDNNLVKELKEKQKQIHNFPKFFSNIYIDKKISNLYQIY